MDEDEEQSDNDQSQDDSGGSASLTDEHKEAIGNGLVQAAQARGIDVTTLAQQIGLSTDDISAFTEGDYLKAAEHLAREHPDIVENFTDQIPVLGGLIRNFLGGNR